MDTTDSQDFLQKYSDKTFQHQLSHQLRPIISSIKYQILQQNLAIQTDPGISIQGYQLIDDEYATKALYQKFFSKKKYISPHTNQISYPHNQYSIYTPVNSQIDVDDEFVRTFPILKKHKDQFNAQAKADIYTTISREIRIGDPAIAWRKIVRRWIWEADVFETLFYYKMLMREGYSVLDRILVKYPYVDVSVIEQHLERFARMFHKTSTIRNNTQFSIDITEEINQISIVKSAKQLFCANCLIYDCAKHKLQDFIIENHNQFVHPKNKPTLEKKIESVVQLLKAYEQICAREPGSEGQNSKHLNGCSPQCYLNLNATTFDDLKYSLNTLLSPVIKAIIKLGIQMFDYSPCYINLLPKAKISCAMIFWYFIKVINVKQIMATNFKSSIEYLSSIDALETQNANSRTDNKRRAKKKPFNKRKTVQPNKTVGQNKESNSYSHTTPMCFHYFLNKQTNQATQNCDGCACKLRGFCLPSCMCPPKCPLRMKGCNCCHGKKNHKSKADNIKTSKCIEKLCPCRQANRQCHPEVCHGCFPVDKTNINEFNKIITCSNNQFQLKIFPKLKIGVSTLQCGGIGLFANQFIPKKSIIIPYAGQTIQNFLQDTRQKIANDMFFYNFGFIEMCIDAKFFGNKARFINHDNNELENCASSIRFAKTDFFLAVYAQKDINKDEELFFDYDGFGNLFNNFRDKYPFIKKRIKPFTRC